MRALAALFLFATALAAPANGQQPIDCQVPGYLLVDDSELGRVAAAVQEQKKLDIAVIGTGSSTLAGSNGASAAYPERLQAALRRRLPDVAVEVRTFAKSRQSAEEMLGSFDKALSGFKPVLVIWQSGTADAMRGIDPEAYGTILSKGIEVLHAGGADVILMNMQYSPRTESVISLGAYADNMRVVARDQNVPLFDRLAIMRHWNDTGVFDLSAATRDNRMAVDVHDCIGRALATRIIDAAKLNSVAASARR